MDPVQDPKTNLPPTIMPTTEDVVPTPPPTPISPPSPVPIIEPPIGPAPVPASDSGDNAQIIKPKVKWGKGALIGSVAALMVLVVGLGFGLWQIRQNQNIKPLKAGLCDSTSPNITCVITDNKCVWKPDNSGACLDNWYIPGTEYFCGEGAPGQTITYGCTDGYYPTKATCDARDGGVQ